MATILVIDDQPTNREYLVTLLGYAGHRLLEAADGEQGLGQVRAERPDLVIADVLMPVMDGYEFVRQLRADPEFADTRVIFFTATYYERAARVLAEKCGVVHFITKPCEPQEVLRVVDEALNAIERAPEAQVAQDFNPEHVRLLTDKLSHKVSELEVVNQQLRTMNVLGRQLALERDAHRLLELFCQAGREVIGARYAALGVLEDDSQLFRHFLTCGLDGKAANRIGKPSSQRGLLGSVIEQAQPFRVCGATAGEAWFPDLPALVPASSLMGVPMASPARLYGALFLVDKLGTEEFSEDDEAAALTLATQAAVAYENVRRFEDIRRHAVRLEREVAERSRAEQEIRLLSSMTLAIAGAADLNTALEVVLRKLCEVTGWVLGQAWTPSSDGSVLECSPAWYCRAPGLERFRIASESNHFLPNASLPARAWVEKKPIWLEDLAHIHVFPRAKLAQELGLRAGIAMPVFDGSEVIAVVEFYAFEQREESERLGGLVSAVSAQLGTVIQRKRAEAQIRVREGQQAIIAALGQEALAGIELDGLLPKTATLIARNLDVEYCKILELEPDGKSLLLRAGVGWKEGLIGRARVNTGTESQAGYTLTSSEPVIVEDLRTEIRFAAGSLLSQHDVTSGMSVIIHSHGSGAPWGALCAHSRERRRFTQDDVNFLQSAANLIANAVDRLREERELKVAKDTAEAANRAKDQFLARLSHELRTPLTPVLVTVSASIDDPATPATMRPMLEMTKRNVELEARLIDDLLDITRISTGRLQLDRGPVDIHG
ncbi:MAG TPA: GAF domain-containing protein, partial [Isosphaeraceae bacterium]|nr:GAF domain-containing protein [Isosphaeraceae bacterium]